MRLDCATACMARIFLVRLILCFRDTKPPFLCTAAFGIDTRDAGMPRRHRPGRDSGRRSLKKIPPEMRDNSVDFDAPAGEFSLFGNAKLATPKPVQN